MEWNEELEKQLKRRGESMHVENLHYILYSTVAVLFSTIPPMKCVKNSSLLQSGTEKAGASLTAWHLMP